MSKPMIQVNNGQNELQISEESTSNTRRTLHQNIFGKLRPVPLQYHWTVWFDKHSNPESSTSVALTNSSSIQTQQQYTSRLTVLYEDISDIAVFYRVYNNFPWDKIRLRDTVHIFRKGVKPVWEDSENLSGGCWTFRVPKAKGQEFFHEIAILVMGNELQAAVESEHDHILGVSISIRFNTHLISVWNKLGSNERSIKILEQTIIDRLSPELRPADKTVVSSSSYFYKRHADHEGFRGAIERARSSEEE
ncbi:translation initiation factor eIF4E, putative [Talaromyces stipitatus ATCC 10500]|uniref:Translation initiation factor eIF4E, putative n=1 Tax=Talaromyces stipitatus (strain ATCC 10500 / CBS 375.48 / QM 6759 / NRRL 1006) TaxID=441959 RepID=B8MK42_TALSN|nr:translation initiation factor eIF4E, putative [Talaromyces stipitatus ATCC 10500]EED14859.1 translation initiation factor eIF4E, putative [Talaromyces stipitatus ATCC 10500]